LGKTESRLLDALMQLINNNYVKSLGEITSVTQLHFETYEYDYSHTSTSTLMRLTKQPKEFIMWTTPAATEMRFGFEVTMYVMNK
jgi:coenzyme PQQ precursor peptide PqqA